MELRLRPLNLLLLLLLLTFLLLLELDQQGLEHTKNNLRELASDPRVVMPINVG